MPDSPNTLVAGVTKWIRLFDIRSMFVLLACAFFLTLYFIVLHNYKIFFCLRSKSKS